MHVLIRSVVAVGLPLVALGFAGCENESASLASVDSTGMRPNGTRKVKVVYENGVPTPVESAGRGSSGGKAKRMPSNPAGGAMPPGMGAMPPEMGAMPPGVMPPGMGEMPPPPTETGSLSWEVPATWKKVAPTSAMRMAQYVVPRAAGDAEDAEVAVFYFGNSGAGGLEETFTRWASSFGTDASSAKRWTAKGRDAELSFIEVTGTYQPAPMMGGAESEPKAGMRMVGAVVVGSDGPYYFKLVGPDRTVVGARADLVKTLENAGSADGRKEADAGVGEAGQPKP